jgi:hypothetical protein
LELAFVNEFYHKYIKCLLFNDVDSLIENHYNQEAVLIGSNFTIRGHQTLRKYFHNYLNHLSYLKLEATNNFTYFENAIFLRFTVIHKQSELKAYDIWVLENGKIDRHFTGVI